MWNKKIMSQRIQAYSIGSTELERGCQDDKAQNKLDWWKRQAKDTQIICLKPILG